MKIDHVIIHTRSMFYKVIKHKIKKLTYTHLKLV